MNRLFILLFLMSVDMMVAAQKDSTLHLKKDTIKNTSRTPIRSSGSRDSAIAKTLAAELKNSGVSIDANDIDDITQAIAEGGQSAMAIAQFVVTSIAEIKAKQSQENPSSQKKVVELSEKQVNGILQSLKKDSSLLISRYLNVKLTQLKKDQQPIVLTSSQQQWLNTNYKNIGALKKDNAAVAIRKNFVSIPEASLEYMISLAAKLLADDNRQQLSMMKQMLEQLKQQKQALLTKIQEKENQLAKTSDAAKRQAISNEILELKKKLKLAEEDIRKKEETIRQLST